MYSINCIFRYQTIQENYKPVSTNSIISNRLFPYINTDDLYVNTAKANIEPVQNEDYINY